MMKKDMECKKRIAYCVEEISSQDSESRRQNKLVSRILADSF